MVSDGPDWSLPDPASSTEQLKRALKNAEGLAEYARTQKLQMADELLTEVIALLIARSTGLQENS
jgi:hypothetical protein